VVRVITGLGERQLRVLFYRNRLGLSYNEIGNKIGTTKQNVHSMLKRISKNYSSCLKVIEEVEAISNPFVEVMKGSSILEVSDDVIKTADSEGIKLRGNKNDVLSWIKWNFRCNNLKVEEEGGIVIRRDGTLFKVTSETIKRVKAIVSQLV